MDRRKLIKTLGLSAAVITTGFIGACNTEDSQVKKELQELRDSLKDAANKPKSERDKKNVNRTEMNFQDSENPTDFELKHTPKIKLGSKDELSFTEVKITVGTGIIHPTKVDHWIDFIKLYADDNLVGDVEFEAGKASGYSVFKIKTEGVNKLKAVIGCNLHGIWHSEIELS